jgi:hypothetical protein
VAERPTRPAGRPRRRHGSPRKTPPNGAGPSQAGCPAGVEPADRRPAGSHVERCVERTTPDRSLAVRHPGGRDERKMCAPRSPGDERTDQQSPVELDAHDDV